MEARSRETRSSSWPQIWTKASWMRGAWRLSHCSCDWYISCERQIPGGVSMGVRWLAVDGAGADRWRSAASTHDHDAALAVPGGRVLGILVGVRPDTISGPRGLLLRDDRLGHDVCGSDGQAPHSVIQFSSMRLARSGGGSGGASIQRCRGGRTALAVEELELLLGQHRHGDRWCGDSGVGRYRGDASDVRQLSRLGSSGPAARRRRRRRLIIIIHNYVCS